jgi:cytochrome c553
MKIRRKSLAIAGIVGALLAAAGAAARSTWVREARELGFSEITDCSSCHVERGKRELAERGKWLVGQRQTRNAQIVDLRWLKDYQPTGLPEERKRK